MRHAFIFFSLFIASLVGTNLVRAEAEGAQVKRATASARLKAAATSNTNGPAEEMFQLSLRHALDSRLRGNDKKHTHRFWDRQNKLLFAAGIAGRAADTITTRQLMNRGGREWILPQRVADSDGLMTAYSAGAHAASWGLAYLAHRTGHHKIERILAWANFAGPAGFAINNHFQGR